MTALLPYIAAFSFVGAIVLLLGRTFTPLLVIAYGLLLALVLLAAVDVMGLPKPMWAEVRGGEDIYPDSAIYHPDVAIYIVVNSTPPRIYRLPWNTKTARQMQKAERESGGMVIRRGQTEGGEWIAHPLPQRTEPPKARNEPRQNP